MNLLDFSTGMAVDFFVSNECYRDGVRAAAVPRRRRARRATGQKYFGLFKEQPLPKGEQQSHRYRITYDQGAAELRFYVEGELVNREVDVPKMESFLIALGLMTEKDIPTAHSVSCHGQGLVGEWSPITITRRSARG